MFEIQKLFKKSTNIIKVSENAIRTAIPVSIKDYLELDADHKLLWIAYINENGKKIVEIQKSNEKDSKK